jgi:hypothetical protein
MRSSAVVEVEIAADRVPRLSDALVGSQIYLLVLDATLCRRVAKFRV